MKELFTMSGKELLFYDSIQKSLKDGLKQVKAAELLGISERHYRRLLKAYKEKGIKGLVSKKRGKPSNNRIHEDIRKKIIDKLKNKYTECGPTFVWGKLIKNEGLDLSHETVRKIMIQEGFREPKKRKRLKLYQRRQRRACAGELIQMDGSPLLGLKIEVLNAVY
jgi:transposase